MWVVVFAVYLPVVIRTFTTGIVDALYFVTVGAVATAVWVVSISMLVRALRAAVAQVMIRLDPHERSHTAAAVDDE